VKDKKSNWPRPALREPRSVLIGEITARLLNNCPDSFAGVAFAPDGVLEVYSTGGDDLARVVAELAANAAHLLRLRVVTGMTNSFRDLEDLRQQVPSRQAELERNGVHLRGWGIDILGNRLELRIKDPTPEKVAYLEAEFGPGRVRVVEGHLYTTS
jgi:hypothetical protein